ncbi:MAG: glycogen debranching enzyme GlgX [Candidatus Zixiibacteriota bacterium]|nr:MAG: glycogen debranching enzyme GlgX [candidate division Zixibacteria bacterium]
MAGNSVDNIKEAKNRNFLDIVSPDFEISRGGPLPLGATPKRGGINFAVYSKNATSVSLVLFIPGGKEPIAEFPFDPRFNRTGDIWHAFIRGLEDNIEYGYRVDRQPNFHREIHRFDSSRILVDPYARALSGGEIWGDIDVESGNGQHRQYHSVITDNSFDWGSDQPLNTPLSETIIYELHVRGFSRHKSSQVKYPGTYAGLVEKIPYLKSLGITAVELLPINEFSEIDSGRIDPRTGKPLLNYWGYNSITFFAPKASYAHKNNYGRSINEFKAMVKAFHEAGIEVILDMVFNHTAEGDHRGPTFSFRGLDNKTYYLISPDTGEYHNYSGCGNTLNCNHPVVRDMILDCLRYWVTEMHVDGFRFDLASILGRGQDGSVLSNPPLLERIAGDPILGNTKLIAEAWDAAGLYQVGTFPSYGRWAEWNGKFRDDVRKYVKGDFGVAEALANRLIGSPDIYRDYGRLTGQCINFITCHDGFTLADLVSYNEKHNEDNGEDNRDGANDNYSWNCGAEGTPDNIKDAEEISALRLRQMKNLATILMISRGVPMILAGDEFGRTQMGNNNAYCQDNEISWIDWRLAEENSDLLRFFRLLIKFRREYLILDDNLSKSSRMEFDPVIWHGVEPFRPDWSYESRIVALQITSSSYLKNNCSDIYVAFNAYWKPVEFKLPELLRNRNWHLKIDTALNSPLDILDNGHELKIENQNIYNIPSRSTLILLAK